MILLIHRADAFSIVQRDLIAVSSTAQTFGQVIGNLVDDFLKRGKQDHSPVARFVAAWWGTFVLHFAMLAIYVGNSDLATILTPIGFLNFLEELLTRQFRFDPEFVFYGLVGSAILLSTLYSSMFALVVAAGVPKGSLMRHFWYGVILPMIAYTMAGTLWKGLLKIGG